ncbi:putative acyl-CoA transferase/carnitine dehydratase [Syncephalis plumigaleata]|nr:putative acyl-CoA transferase/carnitine dehydratase [Syncephalis plumigaleata]
MLLVQSSATSTGYRPLDGIRVLEVGQLIAGPFTGTLLGYYGAVEAPIGGDPLRTWRAVDDDGVSPWYRSLGRNKKSCAIDMRQTEGQALVRELAAVSDVIVENFRPGTMEKWGLGPDILCADNPKLIYTRVSGYGQTGPYAKRPGYASVCEAMGGLRYVTGFPGETPVRSNISLGDSLAGLHSAFGVLLGLLARNHPNRTDKPGQVVDVSIYESVFNMMEGIVPEYDRMGIIREPSGTSITGVVPTNAYRCKDGKYIIIGANGDSIYKRLILAIDRAELTTDEYGSNQNRVKHAQVIDDAITNWTMQYTTKEALERLHQANVPASAIYDTRDIVTDPHYQARDMIEEVDVHGRPLKIPAMSPKLTDTPGRSEWAGSDLGAHTRQILTGLLSKSDHVVEALAEKGIIYMN